MSEQQRTLKALAVVTDGIRTVISKMNDAMVGSRYMMNAEEQRIVEQIYGGLYSAYSKGIDLANAIKIG